MKRTVFYIIFFLTCGGNYAFGQLRVDIGIMGSPSISNFYTKGETGIYYKMGSLNYGVITTVHWRKFSFSSGITHLTQGTNIRVEITDPSSPNSGTGTGISLIRVKSVSLPIMADYNLISKKKFDLFAGLGLFTSLVYYQKMDSRWADSYNSNSNVIYSSPPQRYTDFNYFDRYIFHANIGIGIRKKIGRRTNIVIRPNFSYQLRQDLPKTKYAWTIRLYSYSLDAGLLWSIGKKKNEKEEKNTNTP